MVGAAVGDVKSSASTRAPKWGAIRVQERLLTLNARLYQIEFAISNRTCGSSRGARR